MSVSKMSLPLIVSDVGYNGHGAVPFQHIFFVKGLSPLFLLPRLIGPVSDNGWARNDKLSFAQKASSALSRSRFLIRLWSAVTRSLLYLKNELGPT